MKELMECGQRLLDAALEYRALANKYGVEGSVIWLKGTEGEMVIVTRGEYRDQLLRNITERGSTLSFGCSVDVGE